MNDMLRIVNPTIWVRHFKCRTADLLGSNLISGKKSFNDVWHDPDSSGVCVGVIAAMGTGYNLYICKYAKLGIIFNSNSAKTFEKLKTDAVPIPFPNPGKDVVKFTILAGQGKASFTDMQGRKILEGGILAGERN